MYCEQCGAKNEEGTKFCISCGAKMSAEGGIEIPLQSNIKNPAKTVEKKKWVYKLIAGIVSVGIIATVGVVGYNFIADNFGGDNNYENHPLAYVKDGTLWLKKVNKKAPFPVTTSNGYNSVSAEYEGDYGQNSLFQMTQDGKTIFFADGIQNGEFKLYCRKAEQAITKGKNADEKGIRIASGVTSFKIAPDGKFVIYNKRDRLYYSDLKEERSVSSDVSTFDLSDELQKIIFRKNGGDLYICGLGKKDEPEKIDADVSTLVSANNEYKQIYYTKGKELYVKELGKDKVKITADVYGTAMIGDTVYLTKEEKSQKRFADLFNDDCAATDSQITSPSYSDFRVPDLEYGGTKTDYDAYNEAQKKYSEKRARDDVRKYYNDNPQTVTAYTLYKIVNNEVQKVETGVLEGYVGSRIITQKMSDDSKILLSTVTSYSDATTKVSNLKSNVSVQRSIIKKDGTVLKIKDIDEKATNMQISEDDKYLYCVEDVGKSYKGTLNRYDITSSGLASKTKIYDEVSGFNLYGNLVTVHYDSNALGVFDSGKYTELSDSSSWQIVFNNGALYYYDEFSSNNQIGNLMRYKNGQKEQIDIDVHQFVIRSDDLCYYVKDYSTNRNCGELYKKKGNKSEKIDSDVGFIIY